MKRSMTAVAALACACLVLASCKADAEGVRDAAGDLGQQAVEDALAKGNEWLNGERDTPPGDADEWLEEVENRLADEDGEWLGGFLVEMASFVTNADARSSVDTHLGSVLEELQSGSTGSCIGDEVLSLAEDLVLRLDYDGNQDLYGTLLEDGLEEARDRFIQASFTAARSAATVAGALVTGYYGWLVSEIPGLAQTVATLGYDKAAQLTFGVMAVNIDEC